MPLAHSPALVSPLCFRRAPSPMPSPPLLAPSPSPWATPVWPSAPPAPLLGPVFALARVPWVRDFLLSPDAAADVAALVGAGAGTKAWARVRTAGGGHAGGHGGGHGDGGARPGGGCGGLAGFSVELRVRGGGVAGGERVRVVLALAQAANGISVGPAVAIGEDGTLRAGRWVRDEASGLLLLVQAVGARAEIALAAPGPGGSFSRQFLRFNGPAFRAALTAPVLPLDAHAALTLACALAETRAPRAGQSNRPVAAGEFAACLVGLLGTFRGAGATVAGGPLAPLAAEVDVTSLPEFDALRIVMRAAHALTFRGASHEVAPAPRPAPVPAPGVQHTNGGCAMDCADGLNLAELECVDSLERLMQEASPGALRLEGDFPPLLPDTDLGLAFLGELGSPHALLSPSSDTSECSASGPSLPLSAPSLSETSPVREDAALGRRTSPRSALIPQLPPLSEEADREREEKRRIRVFKNRAAAARSNARRKLQNDRLKGALAQARGRVLQLRDRHMELREENLRLKMALLM